MSAPPSFAPQQQQQAPAANPVAAAAAAAAQQAAQQAQAAAQQAASNAQQASTAPVGGVAPAFLAGMPPSMMGVPAPGSAAAGAAPGTPGAFPPGAPFPFMAGLPFPGFNPSAMVGAFNPAMLGGYRFPPMPQGSAMEKQFFQQMMAATAMAAQQQSMMGKKKVVQQPNSQANIKKLGTLGKKLAAAVAGGKDIELDKQLTAIARQKQMHAVPMTPDVRLNAYLKRETVRPEPKMSCPKGHKVTATVAKKALTHNDVYLCNSPEGCGLPCGGNDSHPLHLNVKFLNPQDKHNYLDSCRWLSKNEVETQTKEYIKGHPLVYPHLAAGVLFNDETDAWRGYVLGWNIYFWYMDIERYWASMRRELEEASGAMDMPDAEGETGEERGRGKRKKRKLVGEVASEAQAALEEAEDAAALQAAIEASNDGGAAAASAEVGDKRKQPEPAQGSAPAAAASS